MTFLALVLGPFLAAGVVVGVVEVSRRRMPVDGRPSGGWTVLLAAVLFVTAVLFLVFLWSLAVFNCHGGYECPV